MPAAADDIPRTGGPYVPTPQGVVDEMLQVAAVTHEDTVIDLGSGDGRIVLTAARRHKARGRGVDIDPELIEKSTKEAQSQGLQDLARFEHGDALKARIADATVVTLYLLPELMHQLRDRLFSELKPGSRVVSHDFRFNDWMPDRTVTVDVPEKYGSAGAWQSSIYLWVVPAKIAGSWHAGNARGEQYVLSFTQDFQRITGAATKDGRDLALQEAHLEGNRIRFRLVDDENGSVPYEFSGTIEADAIHGTMVSQEGSVPWRATRRAPPMAVHAPQ